MLCCTGAVLFNLHRDCVSSGPWLRLSKGYNALSEPRRPSVDSGSVAYSKMHFTGLCTSCTSSRSGSPRSARASGERARSSMSVPTMSVVGPDACPTDRLCILNTHGQRMMSTLRCGLYGLNGGFHNNTHLGQSCNTAVMYADPLCCAGI